MLGRPVRRALAHLEQKVADDFPAPRRVRHLRVELDAEEWFLPVLERGNRGVVARCRDLVPRRRDVHMVAVAHPHRSLLALPEPVEQPPARHGDVGATVFPARRGRHPPSRQLREDLHAIAEAQDRRAQVEERSVGGGDVFSVHGVRPAREDYPAGIPVTNPSHGAGRGMDLTIDVRLAHPPRDELGVLGAEVDDQDSVVLPRHGPLDSSG